MKIILILTPARPGEKRKFTAPPLGLLYLGAYVKNAGHEVSVIDADVEGYTLDELAEKITAAKADLIGITVMTTFAANVLNLCRQIKKMNAPRQILQPAQRSNSRPSRGHLIFRHLKYMTR